MTQPETGAEEQLRRRRNALQALSDAATEARMYLATEGDVMRAAGWFWWEGDAAPVQTTPGKVKGGG